MTASQPWKEHDPNLWTADQFLAFVMTRPDEERWQLVDGLAMMMTSPTIRHQRIGKNLIRLLDLALERSRPDLVAYYEVGLRIPGVADFNPMPDIVIVPDEVTSERYVDRFFLIAEVISPSNTAEMIERKLELYQSHPDNLYCLTIDQDSVHVTLYAREDGWSRTDFRSLDDMLALPDFGLEARLAALYRGTPLAG